MIVTEFSKAVQNAKTGKWFAKFETTKSGQYASYVMNEIESAAVFETEDEACAGGARAIATLKETGRFPNMCKPF